MAAMQGVAIVATIEEAFSSSNSFRSKQFQLGSLKHHSEAKRTVLVVRSDGSSPGGLNRRDRGTKLISNAVATKSEASVSSMASKGGHELLLFEALREGLEEEMEKDPRVCVMGEDVDHYGGSYKVTKGLAQKYGDFRVLDTPIAENLFAGMGVGAAMTGLKAHHRRYEHGFPPLSLQSDLQQLWHAPLYFRRPVHHPHCHL